MRLVTKIMESCLWPAMFAVFRFVVLVMSMKGVKEINVALSATLAISVTKVLLILLDLIADNFFNHCKIECNII